MRFHPRVLTAQQKRTLLALAPWTTSHGFYLAGGTALALYLGHRESVDLDWFRNDPIADPGSLVADVQKLVKHPLVVSSSSKGTVVGQIEGVKVSFFHLPFRRETRAKPSRASLVLGANSLAFSNDAMAAS